MLRLARMLLIGTGKLGNKHWASALASRDHAEAHLSRSIDRAVGLIERYLSQRPDAADTREGVIRWWLTRQCAEEARALVEPALAEALRRRLIKTRRGANGEMFYMRGDRDD